MNQRTRAGLCLSAIWLSLGMIVAGCSQADNPTPTAAAPPAAPKPSELELPKLKGKSYDPSSNPRYKKMQENMAKQSGGKAS